MSKGINKVILVGNLGDDPSTKYTQGGMAITNISLATTSSRKDRDGNRVEKTEWHRVKFLGKLGEIAGEYLKKGSQVYVEGELQYGKYTDQSGVDKYTTDIVANQMQMLGGRQEGGDRQQQRPASNQQQGRSEYGQQSGGRQAPPMDDFADDNLPDF